MKESIFKGMKDLPSSTAPQESTLRGPPAGFPAPPDPERGPISVTELLRSQYPFTVSSSTDEIESGFDETEPKDGIALGRWIHRLLQILPLDSSINRRKDSATVEALRLFGRAPEPGELEIVLRLLNNFYTSPTAREIQKAKRVLREFPFLFKVNDHQLRAKVDLAFEDDEGWTLVDYKSDHYDPASETPSGFYRDQLLIYSVGWEVLTGKSPLRSLIFYLHAGHCAEIVLNDVNRKRIAELLGQTVHSRKSTT